MDKDQKNGTIALKGTREADIRMALTSGLIGGLVFCSLKIVQIATINDVNTLLNKLQKED